MVYDLPLPLKSMSKLNKMLGLLGVKLADDQPGFNPQRCLMINNSRGQLSMYKLEGLFWGSELIPSLTPSHDSIPLSPPTQTHPSTHPNGTAHPTPPFCPPQAPDYSITMLDTVPKRATFTKIIGSKIAFYLCQSVQPKMLHCFTRQFE